MKVAIMQPYLFPYIGYWQLINAVDELVILDDVNYIKRGYINRNSILINGTPYMFSIPISQASQNRLIMDTQLNFPQKEREKFLKRIELAYKKAPQYANVMPIIHDIIENPQDDLTKYTYYQLIKICEYLQIKTNFKFSSQIEKNCDLKGQDKIIEICMKESADIYINPSGGRRLYDSQRFCNKGIKLFFLDIHNSAIVYKQTSDTFVSNMSIIDVLMSASLDTMKQLLKEYSLADT